ncbi:MAG: Smr/MutS family protein [Rhizobiaceae bacterium]|nr:Smr/MutS family protein [Rhizobiaceae bacterium]
MVRRTKQDWELWERVKKTAVPLNANRAKQDFSSLLDEPQKIISQSSPASRPARVVKPYSPEPAIRVSLAAKPPILDDVTNRKIARGKTSIDGRIDLHGMTQNEAYNSLFHFVENAHLNGKRTVLVITGKGIRGEGILKQAVPRWLSEPIFKNKVIGFHEAHITHGGSGALYVRLRNKNREISQ